MRFHTLIVGSLLLAVVAAEFVPIEHEFTEGKEAAEQVQRLISESILKPFAEKYEFNTGESLNYSTRKILQI